jgi:hypothetical protein
MSVKIAITYLSAARFASSPQVGIRIEQEWHALLRWLAWPTFADDKRAAGAWCPCDLEGGAVKAGKGPVSLLVADVDDCGGGAIDRSAELLAPYVGAVIPTFSATPEKPKHRIVLLPSRPLTAEEFPIAWPKMASTLADAGILVDRGCKNINRLYFACVARSPEAWLGARLLNGTPIDVDGMLAAARADAEAERVRRPTSRPIEDRNRDRYVAGAIDRARANLMSAPEGSRHDLLLREVFSLARLGLSDVDLEAALLEPFVAVAGESRRREGERAIRDAAAARSRAAAS